MNETCRVAPVTVFFNPFRFEYFKLFSSQTLSWTAWSQQDSWRNRTGTRSVRHCCSATNIREPRRRSRRSSTTLWNTSALLGRLDGATLTLTGMGMGMGVGMDTGFHSRLRLWASSRTSADTAPRALLTN